MKVSLLSVCLFQRHCIARNLFVFWVTLTTCFFLVTNNTSEEVYRPTWWRLVTTLTPLDIRCIIQGGAKRTNVFYICLRFLSLGLPQIKSLRTKTSYSRRSESFHSRRNCNCATRNVSKCDAELWGEAPNVCTARRTPSYRHNFP